MAILAGRQDLKGESDSVWLAIKELGPNSRHCGIVYRGSDGHFYFVHLAFHFDLRNQLEDSTYKWSRVGLDADNQTVLAAFAMVLGGNGPTIPYGFNSDGIIFDPSTGKLAPPPSGRGLTCATFVLKFLETYGFHLLDSSTWLERPDDPAWRDWIVENIANYSKDPRHAESIIAAPLGLRIRPEEIIGAASRPFQEWPVSFDAALILANQVLAELA